MIKNKKTDVEIMVDNGGYGVSVGTVVDKEVVRTMVGMGTKRMMGDDGRQ